MRIKYVGAKPEQTDHYYGTGKTWLPGQVHEVDDAFAPKLLQHPDVWVEDNPEAPPAPIPEPHSTAQDAEQSQTPTSSAPFVLKSEDGDGRTILVDSDSGDEIDVTNYDDEDFKLFAKTHGLKLDMRLRGEKLVQAFLVAATLQAEV